MSDDLHINMDFDLPREPSNKDRFFMVRLQAGPIPMRFGIIEFDGDDFNKKRMFEQLHKDLGTHFMGEKITYKYHKEFDFIKYHELRNSDALDF